LKGCFHQLHEPTINQLPNLVPLAREQLDHLPTLAGHVVGPSLYENAALFKEVGTHIQPAMAYGVAANDLNLLLLSVAYRTWPDLLLARPGRE
jgi:hypothetical protein